MLLRAVVQVTFDPPAGVIGRLGYARAGGLDFAEPHQFAVIANPKLPEPQSPDCVFPAMDRAHGLFSHGSAVWDSRTQTCRGGAIPRAKPRKSGKLADLGGSISAEHVIGVLKAKWLSLARTDGEQALFRRIRAALDPSGILNPHVLPGC